MALNQEEGAMSMSRWVACLTFCLTGLCGGAALAGPFNPGDLVVLQTNPAAVTDPTSMTVPVSLAEYSPTGSLVQTINVSSLATSAGLNLTLQGAGLTAENNEGYLSRSGNGRFLTLGGYNAASGSTTSANYTGVIARVDSSGAVSFTNPSDTFNPNSGPQIQGVTSNDGTRFWVASDIAVSTTTAGSSGALTPVLSSSNGFFSIRVINGQLYIAAGTTSAATNILQTNPPLPTGSATTTTLAAPNEIVNEFVFLKRGGGAGVDTLYYVADTGGTTAGLQKYFFNGTTWQAAGTTSLVGGVLFGLTGFVDPNTGNANLFMTTGNGGLNMGTGTGGASQLVEFTDTAAFNATINGTSAVLATAPTGFTFKGLDFAPQAATPTPEPGTLLLGGVAALGMAGVRYLRRRRVPMAT
jgi:hypothetical protein